MKTAFLSLLFVSSAFALDTQSFKLTSGPKTCPAEITIIKTDNCLELSMLQTDASVQMNEYCALNEAPVATEVENEETKEVTTTIKAEVQIQNRYVFTETKTVQSAKGVVTKTQYAERALAVSEKSATMTVREREYALMQLPKAKTLACFYSTDAE